MRPEIAHDGRVVFVSDVHLYFGGGPYLEQFLEFLRAVPPGAAALYIHGDLFDFYVGPRQGALAFYRPLFESLSGLVRSGVPVTVLHGNRDFLIGSCFRRAGVQVVPDDLVLRLGDRRVHLSHGDQFCIHDHSYQFWARGVLRARPVQWLVKGLPVAVGVWLARRYRSVSRRKMARRSGESRLPTIFDGVRQLIAREAFDAVICGHIHDLAATPLEARGRATTLYTTGAWEEGPNYIEWRDGKLELHRIASSLGDGLGTAGGRSVQVGVPRPVGAPDPPRR